MTRRRRPVVLVAAAVVVVALVAVGTVLTVRALRGPAPAAVALDLSGDLSTHDPALVVGEGDEPWYVFSTGGSGAGGSPQVRRSTDGGRTWELVGTVWDSATRPAWVDDVVPGVTNFWAPAVVRHDDLWYLYYSASTFGSNRSAIGLTTATTLDPDDPAYGWTDRGQVVASTSGDPYNAIDPSVVDDEDGTPWMVFGSFWGGIQLVELSWPSGMPADADPAPVTVAARTAAPNAIEGAQVLRHDGWYYLFVSRDSCCQGTSSTYNMAVGRSRSVTGPYTDRAGTDMVLGAAEPLLASHGDMVGPGGESVGTVTSGADAGDYLAFHYYDARQAGAFRLEIRRLAWDGDGWPVATTAAEQEPVEG